MRIGELAKQAGVRIDTIRHYERNGILPAASRSASGYREYGAADLERMEFILRAKALGFTLQETAELLSLTSQMSGDMASMKMAAQRRLDDVERRIEQLTAMRDGLRQIIDACPGAGRLEECPIVRTLTGDAP